jgi:hypothetical protein
VARHSLQGLRKRTSEARGRLTGFAASWLLIAPARQPVIGVMQKILPQYNRAAQTFASLSIGRVLPYSGVFRHFDIARHCIDEPHRNAQRARGKE